MHNAEQRNERRRGGPGSDEVRSVWITHANLRHIPITDLRHSMAQAWREFVPMPTPGQGYSGCCWYCRRG